ncbi:MAG TPA: YicC/YloC family endoribonuclease [Burkholderiales bacterium]|nr:YicC/YloC family endoribonuclease [Burkholderiales bacterium]
MIYSMTGYAVASADSPRGALALELRTVNSRFLDMQFRVAEELRAAEPMLRELISGRIARGKVDCRLSFGNSAPQTQKHLNLQAMTQLRDLTAEAASAFPGASSLRIVDVLRWPGVLAEPAADEDGTRAAVDRLCRDALDELCAARGREGAKLAAILLGRVADMRKRLAEVAPLVPEAVAAHRARLAERLREVLDAGIEDRIRTEIALFAAKSDVDEEITRLATHLDEVERVLARGGAAGKRLDFLAQELNREANTLASKAAGLKIADCALELKLLIEQIREQVQNIE